MRWGEDMRSITVQPNCTSSQKQRITDSRNGSRKKSNGQSTLGGVNTASAPTIQNPLQEAVAEASCEGNLVHVIHNEALPQIKLGVGPVCSQRLGRIGDSRAIIHQYTQNVRYRVNAVA